MKQVWQCDFCSFTSKEKVIVFQHEQDCDCNPVNKSCIVCKNYNSSAILLNRCKLNKSTSFAVKFKNCDGWEYKNKLELRKLKIKKLIK